MKVKEFLLKETKANDLIIFRREGWQIGMTQIDRENLFLQSLNHDLLNEEVKCHYEEYKRLKNYELDDIMLLRIKYMVIEV